MTLSRPVTRVEERLLCSAFGISVESLPLRHPRGLIVGERPGPSTSRSCPMFPWPASSAGGRLLGMSGVSIRDYLTLLRRVNAQYDGGPWRLPAARERAEELAQYAARLYGPLRVVLCGRRAAEAFGLGDQPWFQRLLVSRDGSAHTYVVVPHPSARNQLYRDENVPRAVGRTVRWAAGLED